MEDTGRLQRPNPIGKFVVYAWVISALVVLVNAQFSTNTVKPGACSPLAIGICSLTCTNDFSCPGSQKCCKTACGGTVCTKSVSESISKVHIKPGSCPGTPTGPWVCSHSCRTDADCRGKLKCCKNRCKALACQKPEP